MIHRSPVWVRLFIHFKPVSSSAVYISNRYIRNLIYISHRLLHSCEETFCYYALGQTDCVSLQSANPIAYSPVPFMPTEESLQNVLLAVWALGLVLIWWQILFFFFSFLPSLSQFEVIVSSSVVIWLLHLFCHRVPLYFHVLTHLVLVKSPPPAQQLERELCHWFIALLEIREQCPEKLQRSEWQPVSACSTFSLFCVSARHKELHLLFSFVCVVSESLVPREGVRCSVSSRGLCWRREHTRNTSAGLMLPGFSRKNKATRSKLPIT